MFSRKVRHAARASRLILALAAGLTLSLALLLLMNQARPVAGARAPVAPAGNDTSDYPSADPVISDTASQTKLGLSGDCVVYRNEEDGGVRLHHLTSGETYTISAMPDAAHKVAVSQGVVVWRSERAGEVGLWGYYEPRCSDAGPFSSTTPISPFHILSRTHTQALALAGELLTFDTWAPKGWWYVALLELDADDDGVPDATEPGYNPVEPPFVPITPPDWQGSGIEQRLSDLYCDDTYCVACWYDNTGGIPSVECLNLAHRDEAEPWQQRFEVARSTDIPLDWDGTLSVWRDLVIWTDAHDMGLSGYDLYVADLDLDDDGLLNPEDPTPGAGPAVFPLITYPWHQMYPDLGGYETTPGQWQLFATWVDRRNDNQPDIYAYDLSLDSDGDGVPNWKDPDRFCIDPAEFPVVQRSAIQTTPELWGDTVVWLDARDSAMHALSYNVYRTTLTPVTPRSRTAISGTAREKALAWLDAYTFYFTPVQQIPGYIQSSGLVTRYKSFIQGGQPLVRRAWYTPSAGAYLVGYDYCYYGTPEQKRYLGRFGRGFTYDQGLAMIARTMHAQPAEAAAIGRYLSSFQNSGQLTSTPDGSLGFFFNGQGFWGEKDNFYDMDYLRTGANAWAGYGLLFYARQADDAQFTDTLTRLADYILTQQVRDHSATSPTQDLRYGLFTGGQGRWTDQGFQDEAIQWAAAEHNIDAYFLLRDMGQWTGEPRYVEATERLRAHMDALWDEEKGRLNQGMGLSETLTGTLTVPDTGDALDAASWGAMYWLAVGDRERARRSLAYADTAYRNTVTVSSTLSIWGYKPYHGVTEGFDWSTATVVWSEGSLGVAMASLKLGRALLACGDPAGEAYVDQARAIVTEMQKLQDLDPQGGLLYAQSDGTDVPDFPAAPSAAGTTWLLMVQAALEDEELCDAFWSADPDLIRRVTLSGPTAGQIDTAYTFSATVQPLSATLPVTYHWRATGQLPVTHTGRLSGTATGPWSLSDNIVMRWETGGLKRITVTVRNARNAVDAAHTVLISPSNVYLPLVLKH